MLNLQAVKLSISVKPVSCKATKLIYVNLSAVKLSITINIVSCIRYQYLINLAALKLSI